MPKNITNSLAALMLIFMLSLAYFSMLGDSAIIDEVAHLPAGYSYIEKMDMRLNPEHPPLVKDLAGGAIWLYSKITGETINFPTSLPAWQSAVNGQWDFGFDFLYREGNDADKLIFFGRLPMLLILLILGLYVFKWTRELAGPIAGLLALFLYSFSPTFIAHGRFVTTDVAASAAIFIASYYFIRWLKNPSAQNLIVAGLVFGLAQTAKFSVFLLVILFAFIALFWTYLKIQKNRNFWQNTYKYLGGVILLFAIGYIFIVWPIYLFHVAKYPIDRQVQDTIANLQSFGMRPIANLIIWLAGVPILRGLAQYGLGLAMVLQRAVGGNTTYFLGEINNSGWPLYFPVVYLIKETLTLHILTFAALFYGLWQLVKNKIYRWAKLYDFLRQNIAQILMLAFIALYWYSSFRSILNIGVRHILPTFPFIFLLVSQQISSWMKNSEATQLAKILKLAFVAILIIWQAISVVRVYPLFLAYFNESIGGPANGYKYVVDSNLDWGQDLKRLTTWVNDNKIDKIRLHYFGGGVPEYYLGDKFIFWWGKYPPQDITKQGGWLAVSATFLQGGRGQYVPGFHEDVGDYTWLNNYTPVAIIGHSIFVYYIPPAGK
ncbi:glycosyltransferase family 39 protein [Patescibacteria group bacterium]|nr:glycosyltransferase family 39 protein [Patescibacteria group bacterium]MBU2219979.1 glycosyltransferase family 39 protein [Patescibacteria group bacterium]